MAFETFKQDSFTTYHGIRVSTRSISVSISIAKILKENGFKRVNVEYDRDEGIIKLVKCEEDGFRIGWAQIPARVVRVMPGGRYKLIKSGKKEISFKKQV